MRRSFALPALMGISLAAAVLAGCAATGVDAGSPHIAAAVADQGRPQADRDRDATRKPAEMLAFAGVRPGSIVAEYIPGGGYFTRIFSKAVGPAGKVYVLMSPPAAGRPAAVAAIAADAAYSNVTLVQGDLSQIKPPELVDVVWTSQNYHDVPAAARAEMNRRALEMLKPGGIYIVLDHSGVAGSGDAAIALHRMDEAVVRSEVQGAGFQFAGESNALRRPADDRTTRVFDSSIRGDTDQFILKFRKAG